MHRNVYRGDNSKRNFSNWIDDDDIKSYLIPSRINSSRIQNGDNKTIGDDEDKDVDDDDDSNSWTILFETINVKWRNGIQFEANVHHV